jgi:hypothetical protein
MVHCGFEGTSVVDSIHHPYKLIPLAVRGVKTSGPFKPDIDTSKQRPAEFVFSSHVDKKLAEIRAQAQAKKKPAAPVEPAE